MTVPLPFFAFRNSSAPCTVSVKHLTRRESKRGAESRVRVDSLDVGGLWKQQHGGEVPAGPARAQTAVQGWKGAREVGGSVRVVIYNRGARDGALAGTSQQRIATAGRTAQHSTRWISARLWTISARPESSISAGDDFDAGFGGSDTEDNNNNPDSGT